MIYAFTIACIAVLLYAPSLWVTYVLRTHSTEQPHFPGTGGQFAQHLLDRLDLNDVRLETTTAGDHYDPVNQCVRLSEQNMKGKSLTAITTACHEVGHAIQHHRNEQLFQLRTSMVEKALIAQRTGSIFMMVAPIVALVTRAPAPGFLLFGAGFLAVASMSAVHLVTLPLEWDASFNKAMPILKSGDYLAPRELDQAQRILKACALTYVAGSLASLLNVWRWVRLILRR